MIHAGYESTMTYEEFFPQSEMYIIIISRDFEKYKNELKPLIEVIFPISSAVWWIISKYEFTYIEKLLQEVVEKIT